jgi:protein-L-isoaspartate O-methyltransferase
MVQYQSFPDSAGDSRSLDKLKALGLPALEGKSFLDVGCNEGFFCGFAKFAGAARVVGIDQNAEFVRRARARFPDCEFHASGWDQLPDGSFDVILLASALHYADDQPRLINQLTERLTRDGVLVLELGIVHSEKPEWITVKRGIDQRQFPSMPLLVKLLDGYAWKWMGPSVNQSGDPVPRHVIHISRRRPLAYLLMQPPAFGKSSLAKRLFVPAGVRVVSGDEVLHRIAKGELEVSGDLRNLVSKDYSPLAADETLRRLFDAGLGPGLVQAWLADAGEGDLAIDGFVPKQHHAAVKRAFEDSGYLPIMMQWDRLTHLPMDKRPMAKQVDGFYRSLAKGGRPPLPPKPDPARKFPAGYVDGVRVSAGGISVRGWAVDEHGHFPTQLVVGVGAERTILDIGNAKPRKDVQSHLDWPHPDLGFTFTLPLPAPCTLAELGSQGFSVTLLSGRPLGLSAAVRNALHVDTK